MAQLDQILTEIGHPLNAGNVMVPVGALLDCYSTASGGGRQRIYCELRAILQSLPSISETERSWVRARLEAIAEGDEFLEGERQDILECLLNVTPAPFELTPGSVLILLESVVPFQGRLFGAVQPLVVGVEHWKRQVPRLVHDVDREAMQAGFEPAVHAAKDFIRRRLQGGLDIDIRLGETAVTGRLPWLRERVEGYSLGLGSAVALISRLLGLPVPADTAFTGRVELDGSVAPVGGGAVKAAAAREKGLRRIVVPDLNKGEFGAGDGVECIGVNRLETAIDLTFNRAALDEALRAFREQALPAERRRREAWGPDPRKAAGPRVLLSCISDSDPEGAPARGGGQPPERGPILTLCAEFLPSAVYVFYVANRKEDWEHRIERIRDILAQEHPEIRSVEPILLKSVTNPTDYNQLLPAFRDAVIQVVRGQSMMDTVYCVNVKSGTPQLRLPWFLLYERGEIPQGRLYDVRTTAEAQGGPRVVEVMLPAI